ncbi:hypothetical protein BGZ58_006472 [Dissophora ornata]|nr:hypothetical protein BGZ58_006472 [Dissophora ornata]
MLIEPGDLLAVDGIVLESRNITCDESSATGESDVLKKKDPEEKCYVISGSEVLDGSGCMLVTAVGPNSFFRKAGMAMREASPDETPLQLKLDLLLKTMTKLSIASGVAMLITLVVEYFVQATLSDGPFPSGADIFSILIRILIQAVVVMITTNPDIFLAAAAFTLAYATTQMLIDNNLVRVLFCLRDHGKCYDRLL